MFFIKILRIRVLAKCGHKTKLKDKVSAFGETIITEIKCRNGKVEYCHKCLEKMTIKCAWCAKPIFIGDPVTLYSSTSLEKMAEHVVIFSEELMQVVGCGRSSCAQTGADYVGIWVPGENGKGIVERIPTMIERSLISISSGGDGIVFR